MISKISFPSQSEYHLPYHIRTHSKDGEEKHRSLNGWNRYILFYLHTPVKKRSRWFICIFRQRRERHHTAMKHFISAHKRLHFWSHNTIPASTVTSDWGKERDVVAEALSRRSETSMSSYGEPEVQGCVTVVFKDYTTVQMFVQTMDHTTPSST